MPHTDALAAAALKYAPVMIALGKALFRRDNPDAPEPTDAAVLAAFHAAFDKSLAVDDKWLAEHPRNSG